MQDGGFQANSTRHDKYNKQPCFRYVRLDNDWIPNFLERCNMVTAKQIPQDMTNIINLIYVTSNGYIVRHIALKCDTIKVYTSIDY